MAITKSAKKAIRVAKRRKVDNSRRVDVMRDAVKSFRKLVLSGDKKGAGKALQEAYKTLDKAAKRGVIKKKTASRKKSRLAKSLAKISK